MPSPQDTKLDAGHFYITKSCNSTKSYNVLTNKSIFTMQYIKKYIEELRKDKKWHTNTTARI